MYYRCPLPRSNVYSLQIYCLQNPDPHITTLLHDNPLILQDKVREIIKDVIRESISRSVTGRKSKKEPDVVIVEPCNPEDTQQNASKSLPTSPACTPGRALAAVLAKKMLEELGQQRREADQKMSSLGHLTSTPKQAHQSHHQISSGGAGCRKQGQRKKEEDLKELEVLREPGRKGWVREVVYSRVRENHVTGRDYLL